MIERAAEKGANTVLERVGLHDDSAGKDIRDLRNLIEDWRSLKRGVLGAVGRAIGIALLGAAAAFAAGKIVSSN